MRRSARSHNARQRITRAGNYGGLPRANTRSCLRLRQVPLVPASQGIDDPLAEAFGATATKTANAFRPLARGVGAALVAVGLIVTPLWSSLAASTFTEAARFSIRHDTAVAVRVFDAL